MEVALEMPQSWGATALSLLLFAMWLWSRGRASHGRPGHCFSRGHSCHLHFGWLLGENTLSRPTHIIFPWAGVSPLGLSPGLCVSICLSLTTLLLPYLFFFPLQKTVKAPRWEVAGQLKYNQNN